MMSLFFPLKKLRRRSRFFALGVIFLVGVAVYHEMVAFKIWTNIRTFSGLNLKSDSWKKAMFEIGDIQDYQLNSKEDSAFRSSYTPNNWKPEYKGQANLHIFEDWCGGSVADLSRNIHYPLYPHFRTTVQKLAVSPQWNDYGLRIFGYIHPYSDGEYLFALSSDDNSEFWLSTDESPFNVELLAWVGKSGMEFTAPGEFDKYACQISPPLRLSAQKRYYFEVIHKQDDKGTDHVELAWLLLNKDENFAVIDSKYISLFVNESSLLLGDVSHIPQTAATTQQPLRNEHISKADMLRKDLRDTLYQMPLLNNTFLQGILPDCSYKPSYVIKTRFLGRYQGLQYVHLSYVYPNDYTRLTHMETQESCFYTNNPSHEKTNGFSQYMTLDHPTAQKIAFHFPWKKLLSQEEDIGEDQMDYIRFLDSGDDNDNNAQKHGRKPFLVEQEANMKQKITSDTRESMASKASKHLQLSMGPSDKLAPKSKFREIRVNYPKLPPELISVTKQPKIGNKLDNLVTPKWLDSLGRLIRKASDSRDTISNNDIQRNFHLQQDQEINIHRERRNAEPDVNGEHVDGEQSDTKGEENQAKAESERKSNVKMGEGNLEEESIENTVPEDHSLPQVFDTDVNWNQTFQVDQMNVHKHRKDAIELNCRILGNLLPDSSEILPVVEAFMDQLNRKHKGQFKLVRVINIVKRVDSMRGSRYLLELEVKDGSGQLFLLSHYVYHLLDHNRQDFRLSEPRMVLCNPVDFHWKPDVTVHVVVPVKNQARWVQQLINDMERMFRDTQDANMNLIIADFSSTDMDVKKALEKSMLPRYQYIKLKGNFQRSAGLQAGVNTVKDAHSIVFLFDLHIYFHSSIIDTIRKHCVEGFMVFAPVVIRLDCGSTPSEARGLWEVNGFGLLGIYKSDLDAVGGMNMREYKANWGGEDWELLDRIIQSGLEVDRIYLRHFFHYYHSKRGMWNHGLSPRAR
ncbi:beta-1,4-N-acetylgalactosaminyltransferase 3 [Antennarius striatus]|uniref:beta-1,4-N-acetylgalactosaminyltransferase 3 n=1 Tax=Antennarius striatus TaxID=241820 RepID=UPI0035B22B0B